MTNTRYCELRDRGIARLSGADTRAFLQGLVTNDVERLDRDPMIYTALLTPQGKYLFPDRRWRGCAHRLRGGAPARSAEAALLL